MLGEPLRLLPGSLVPGELLKELRAVARWAYARGAERDHGPPREVMLLHKGVEDPRSLAPPDGIAKEHRAVVAEGLAVSLYRGPRALVIHLDR